ncbi:hypothetical protein EFP84_19350 [Leptospira kmetyi]|uniref:DUF155 domain-containing protein n=2 Tax=Leptospira kmetyi TaxID=408139 RepID=A0AAD0XSF8_9LEPT|nr:hypothetical protein EFP84_19350 [Leptospira kmetyi]
MIQHSKLYKVYFLSFEEGASLVMPKGCSPMFLEKIKGWYLGFPFDCIVIEGNGTEIGDIHLTLSEYSPLRGNNWSIVNQSRWISIAQIEKNNKEKHESATTMLSKIAGEGYYEMSASYLNELSQWTLNALNKYSKVKTVQLLHSDEIRRKHDESLALSMKIEIIRSLFFGIPNPDWKELADSNSRKSEFLTDRLTALLDTWEHTQETLTILSERVSEKKFLVWEMIAEYTIVVLILLELIIEIMDFILK